MRPNHLILAITICLGVGCCAKLILSTYSTKTVTTTKTTVEAHTNVLSGEVVRTNK